jgi:hypothetical protein
MALRSHPGFGPYSRSPDGVQRNPGVVVSNKTAKPQINHPLKIIHCAVSVSRTSLNPTYLYGASGLENQMQSGYSQLQAKHFFSIAE